MNAITIENGLSSIQPPGASSCDLADIALRDLETTFAARGHKPSATQWGAIRDLLTHLQHAADGRLEPAVYLSAIPAGTGKSQSIRAFARALANDARYQGVGMLVACNRVEEVAAMATDLATHRDKLHVRVGQAHTSVLALGMHDNANGAQIMVATQEALRRILRNSPDFNHASGLHYLGVRRAVVAWDEAIAFHRPVVLDEGQLGPVLSAIGRQPNSDRAYLATLEWVGRLRSASSGVCPVPDFAALGLDFKALEEAAEADDTVAVPAHALGLLSGSSGWLMIDSIEHRRMVTHFPELPPSLMPVIVTDASAATGVHRELYEQMAITCPVRWLKEACKTYSNLTIRIVPTAASRSVYRDRKTDKARRLIEMAVRYIREAPTEDVLVISYKAKWVMKDVAETTIAAAIDAQLTEDERKRVRHLTWGSHTATNEFTGFGRVLVMGLNFLPKAAAHAGSAAALDKPMSSDRPKDHPTSDQVDAIFDGMLRDATLQGLLRGRARMGVDGDCGIMEAVIPQAPQRGLTDEAYQEMFPGAFIRTDRVLMPVVELRGKRTKAFATLIERRLTEGKTELANPELYRDLGMDRKAYGVMLKRPDVVSWLEAHGLMVARLRGGITGLRKAA